MSRRPNILVIFNDDLGQWALPSYGNTEVSAPNIDHLARRGAVLNAFTPTPVCSPARASFFTGLFPSQHGVHDFISAESRFHDVDWLGGHPTLPQLLRQAGYRTGLSGKWHLGRDDLTRDDFDDWFALAGDYPILHKGPHRYSDNGRIVELAGYKTHHIADRTVEFIRNQSPGTPWFHFTGFYATHSPWEGQPERLVERYRGCSFRDIRSDDRVFDGTLRNAEHADSSEASRNEAKAQYYAAVTALDEAVGRILDEVETAGQLDDTMVVFTSDHGLCLDHHGVWGKGNATAPQNMLEESIRIPMLVSLPGQIAGGTRPEAFVDHLDLFQTLLDVSGCAAPEVDRYAGRSMRPLLSGDAAQWRELQFGEYGPAKMARTVSWKLVSYLDRNSDHLFKITARGEELVDAAQHADVVADLKGRIRDYYGPHTEAREVEAFAGPARYNRSEAWRAENGG
jgi:arylsulfatase A-like enzyme